MLADFGAYMGGFKAKIGAFHDYTRTGNRRVIYGLFTGYARGLCEGCRAVVGCRQGGCRWNIPQLPRTF